MLDTNSRPENEIRFGGRGESQCALIIVMAWVEGLHVRYAQLSGNVGWIRPAVRVTRNYVHINFKSDA